MEKSKSIAGIIGPTLTVMVLSELKIWNPTLYDAQIVPLVYLSGALLFVAGLYIVRQHNSWLWGWQTKLYVSLKKLTAHQANQSNWHFGLAL